MSSEGDPFGVTKRKVPSELIISETWDKCIERSLVNVGAGIVVGGLLSLVLARSSHGRGMVTAFAAGAGAGASWVRRACYAPEAKRGRVFSALTSAIAYLRYGPYVRQSLTGSEARNLRMPFESQSSSESRDVLPCWDRYHLPIAPAGRPPSPYRPSAAVLDWIRIRKSAARSAEKSKRDRSQLVFHHGPSEQLPPPAAMEGIQESWGGQASATAPSLDDPNLPHAPASVRALSDPRVLLTLREYMPQGALSVLSHMSTICRSVSSGTRHLVKVISPPPASEAYRPAQLSFAVSLVSACKHLQTLKVFVEAADSEASVSHIARLMLELAQRSNFRELSVLRAEAAMPIAEFASEVLDVVACGAPRSLEILQVSMGRDCLSSMPIKYCRTLRQLTEIDTLDGCISPKTLTSIAEALHPGGGSLKLLRFTSTSTTHDYNQAIAELFIAVPGLAVEMDRRRIAQPFKHVSVGPHGSGRSSGNADTPALSLGCDTIAGKCMSRSMWPTLVKLKELHFLELSTNAIRIVQQLSSPLWPDSPRAPLTLESLTLHLGRATELSPRVNRYIPTLRHLVVRGLKGLTQGEVDVAMGLGGPQLQSLTIEIMAGGFTSDQAGMTVLERLADIRQVYFWRGVMQKLSIGYGGQKNKAMRPHGRVDLFARTRTCLTALATVNAINDVSIKGVALGDQLLRVLQEARVAGAWGGGVEGGRVVVVRYNMNRVEMEGGGGGGGWMAAGGRGGSCVGGDSGRGSGGGGGAAAAAGGGSGTVSVLQYALQVAQMLCAQSSLKQLIQVQQQQQQQQQQDRHRQLQHQHQLGQEQRQNDQQQHQCCTHPEVRLSHPQPAALPATPQKSPSQLHQYQQHQQQQFQPACQHAEVWPPPPTTILPPPPAPPMYHIDRTRQPQDARSAHAVRNPPAPSLSSTPATSPYVPPIAPPTSPGAPRPPSAMRFTPLRLEMAHAAAPPFSPHRPMTPSLQHPGGLPLNAAPPSAPPFAQEHQSPRSPYAMPPNPADFAAAPSFAYPHPSFPFPPHRSPHSRHRRRRRSDHCYGGRQQRGSSRGRGRGRR